MEQAKREIFKIQKSIKIRKLSYMESSTSSLALGALTLNETLGEAAIGLEPSKKNRIRKKSYKKSFEKKRSSKISSPTDMEAISNINENSECVKKGELYFNLLCDTSVVTEDTKSNKSGEKLTNFSKVSTSDTYTSCNYNNNLVLSVSNFSSSFICTRSTVNKVIDPVLPLRSQSSLVIPNFFQDRVCPRPAPALRATPMELEHKEFYLVEPVSRPGAFFPRDTRDTRNALDEIFNEDAFLTFN